MLSYLHGFHAGGVADVHKHTGLVLVLSHLRKKPAPFCVIDTHAGRGLYDLADERATQTGEWRAGIARIAGADLTDPALRQYRKAVVGHNTGGGLRFYPGSPLLALDMMRATDRLILMELHPAEHGALRETLRRDRRVHIHRRDGFEGLPPLVPPPERRGVVLIDPSYEVKAEYETVPACLKRALRRWCEGIYMLWYPILPDERQHAMLSAVERLGAELLIAELTGPGAERGLIGTGLAVINPPHGMREALKAAGAEMASLLFGRSGRHHSRLA